MRSARRATDASRGVLQPAFLALATIATFAHALWYTLFPIFLRAQRMELWQAGLASSLALTLSFVLALPAGVLVDVVPLKLALVAASAGQLATLLLIPHLLHPVPLSAAVSAYTFFMTLRGQASLRLLAAGGSHRSWGTTYSVYLLLTGVSSVAGSYLSGPLVEKEGFGAVYALASALFLAATPLSFVVEDPRCGRGRRAALKLKVLARSGFASLTASLALHDFAVFSATSYVQIFQREVVGLAPSQVSLLSAVSSAVSQAVQLGAGYFADRFGSRKSLALHYLGVSAGYALMGVSDSFEDLLAAIVVQSLFLPFDLPARRKLLSLMAPGDAVATVNGLSDAVVGLVALPSPLLGGWLWYSAGPRGMLAICAALNLTALLPLASFREGGELGAHSPART